MTGAARSTAIGPSGPVVAQLPALSHTSCVPVCAAASSLPLPTLVVSRKDTSAGSARPEPSSLAVQATETSSACQPDGGGSQATSGTIASGGTPPTTTVVSPVTVG